METMRLDSEQRGHKASCGHQAVSSKIRDRRGRDGSRRKLHNMQAKRVTYNGDSLH